MANMVLAISGRANYFHLLHNQSAKADLSVYLVYSA
jgi:hypothetical protein